MAKGVESELEVIEEWLRRLEFEYDQFFNGQLRVLPVKTENALQSLIRTFSRRGVQNSSLRFRYNNVVARYNSLKRVWDRRVLEREEGRLIGRPLSAALPQKSQTAAAKGQDRFVAVDLRRESERMGEIFAAYKTLREECGESTERLRIENFTSILADKVDKLKQSRKCSKVEIRLHRENEKTRILVRPIKDEP